MTPLRPDIEQIGELTPAASRKLRELERKAFMLALRIFAGDARMTTAAIIALSRRGEADEAQLEKAALTGRTLGGWAIATVGLPLPHGNLLEHANPLGIGLGSELQRWLLKPENWLDEAAAWLHEFGPRIERFETARR